MQELNILREPVYMNLNVEHSAVILSLSKGALRQAQDDSVIAHDDSRRVQEENKIIFHFCKSSSLDEKFATNAKIPGMPVFFVASFLLKGPQYNYLYSPRKNA